MPAAGDPWGLDRADLDTSDAKDFLEVLEGWRLPVQSTKAPPPLARTLEAM
jgi:hypothetical protein